MKCFLMYLNETSDCWVCFFCFAFRQHMMSFVISSKKYITNLSPIIISLSQISMATLHSAATGRGKSRAAVSAEQSGGIDVRPS